MNFSTNTDDANSDDQSSDMMMVNKQLKSSNYQPPAPQQQQHQSHQIKDSNQETLNELSNQVWSALLSQLDTTSDSLNQSETPIRNKKEK